MSISLKELQSSKISNATSFKYKDIAFDLSVGRSISNPQVYKTTYKKDLNEILDESAIKNSLATLFSTRKGEKAIDPNYGMNLADFLFRNFIDQYASNIGEQMMDAIQTYESRVTVEQMNVIPDPDNGQYHISIIIGYPNLPNKTTTLLGVFSNNVFQTVN